MVSFNNCENVRVLCVRLKLKKWSSYQREKIMQTTKSMMHGFKDEYTQYSQATDCKIKGIKSRIENMTWSSHSLSHIESLFQFYRVFIIKTIVCSSYWRCLYILNSSYVIASVQSVYD